MERGSNRRAQVSSELCRFAGRHAALRALVRAVRPSTRRESAQWRRIRAAVSLDVVQAAAFDISPEARNACARVAAVNAVSIHLEATAGPQTVRRLVGPDTLVIADAEGTEVDSLDPTVTPGSVAEFPVLARLTALDQRRVLSEGRLRDQRWPRLPATVR